MTDYSEFYGRDLDSNKSYKDKSELEKKVDALEIRIQSVQDDNYDIKNDIEELRAQLYQLSIKN